MSSEEEEERSSQNEEEEEEEEDNEDDEEENEDDEEEEEEEDNEDDEEEEEENEGEEDNSQIDEEDEEDEEGSSAKNKKNKRKSKGSSGDSEVKKIDLMKNSGTPRTVQFDLSNTNREPPMKNISSTVDGIFNQVDMMISNFPCISGKGFGNFTNSSYQGFSRSNLYGSGYYGNSGNASGFMYNQYSTTTPPLKSYRFMTDNINDHNRQFEGMRYSQFNGNPYQYTQTQIPNNSNAPQNNNNPSNPQNEQQASQIDPNLIESKVQEELNMKKEQLIKDAYREAYTKAFQDLTEQNLKMKEKIQSQVMQQVEEKRKVLEMVKSSVSKQEEENEEYQKQYQLELSRLKGTQEQEILEKLEKQQQRKARRDKYQIRDESQKIIDNYYKNFYRYQIKQKEPEPQNRLTSDRLNSLGNQQKATKLQESKFLRVKD